MIKCRLCHSTIVLRSYKVRHYQYCRCYSCQTLFLYPFPKVQSIDRLYSKYDYKNGLIEEQRIRQRSKIIISKLVKLNPQGKTLLDIGCGYGFLLDEAKKRNFSVIGLEPSHKLYQHSLRLIKVNNLHNLSFDKFIGRYKNQKYDFITLIHVIEHIRNPYKLLHQALSLLKPKGVLYIETPNLNSHLFNAENENYTFLTPPEHLWIFSQESFKKLFEDVNVSIYRYIETYSYPEHLMGILKRKFQISNDKLQINVKNKSKINKNTNNKFHISTIKYWLLDKLIAPFFTPLLNWGGYGTFLELYIKKK